MAILGREPIREQIQKAIERRIDRRVEARVQEAIAQAGTQQSQKPVKAEPLMNYDNVPKLGANDLPGGIQIAANVSGYKLVKFLASRGAAPISKQAGKTVTEQAMLKGALA